MPAYAKTWNADAPGYYTATARALNKVEVNAARILTRNKKATWGVKVIGGGAGQRDYATTYTNTASVHRLVVRGGR